METRIVKNQAMEMGYSVLPLGSVGAITIELKWDFKITGIVAIASIIPFGTFYVDKKYLRC